MADEDDPFTEAGMLAHFNKVGVPASVSEAQAALLAKGLGLPWVALPKRKTMWDKHNLAADFARRMRDQERSKT